MAYTVIYDANVLFPAPLRDLLIRVALTGVVRARWTNEILDECFHNVFAQRPDLSEERLQRTRELMNRAIRDSLVTGYEPLIDSISLPDPDDRHVLAAAVQASAQAIITFNLKDFPNSALEPLGIEAKHPDEFILEMINLAPGAVTSAVMEQARSLRNPPCSLADLLGTLANQGLTRSVAKLRERCGLMV